MNIRSSLLMMLAVFVALQEVGAQSKAELILMNAEIATIDDDFRVVNAMAISDGRVQLLGSTDEVMKLRDRTTRVVDLQGKFVMPGFIDSHVHAIDASMVEFDHEIPSMETIADVLQYIRGRAAEVPAGEWIVVRQVFITRLREPRYPTRAELDEAAPNHPVVFSTGPDASVNSLALKESGIDREFKVTGPGKIERDAAGDPTGILRSASRYLKTPSRKQQATESQRKAQLTRLLTDYNRVGITGIIDRSVSPSEQRMYQSLHAENRLTLRVALSRHVATDDSPDRIIEKIDEIAADPLCHGDDSLRIIGIKTFLDGGMLTGSAYMRAPWGISKIYGIDDPKYQGLRYIPVEKLSTIVAACVAKNLQFTAHSVGDGAVHALLDAYEEVNKTHSVAATHSSITHCNFMSQEAVERAAKMKVPVDIQPAWLYLDTRTLEMQFGYDRLRYFQPLKSLFDAGAIAGGGSDHMQKIGARRAVNPYDPFLGMWVTLTRRARWFDKALHPEEALSRQQALRFYTINNAYLMRMEDKVGSLEPGKYADFVVLDRNLLTCDVDDLMETKVEATYLQGKIVYRR